jgi:hypothetical protein
MARVPFSTALTGTLEDAGADLAADLRAAANIDTQIGTSTQAAINALDSEKEDNITAGTSSQVWQGDKTWVAKTDLPISTATQAALDVRAVQAADVAAAAAVSIPATVTSILVAAYDDTYPGVGAARYAEVASEPAHALKIQNGARWFEIDEPVIFITMAGARTGAADNKAAIDAAINAADVLNRPVLVPFGAFNTSGGHDGDFIKIGGLDAASSSLICIDDDPSSYIISVGAISTVSNLKLKWDSSIDLSAATSGDFVAIHCGTSVNLCKGSSIRRVSFEHVGTALHDSTLATFSVLFMDLEIRDFTFAAVDFTSDNRTQNTFINIYPGAGPSGGGRNIATHIYNFEGANDTGMTLINLNAESTQSESALRLRNCIAVTLESIHVEDWCASTTGKSIFDIDRSSVKAGRASIYYSVLKNDCSLFKLGSARREENTGTDQFTNNGLSIDILSVTGLYSDEARTAKVTDSTGINLFSRSDTEASEGPIFVTVGQYSWYSFFAGDETWYAAFNISGDIRFVRKGGILPSGTTAERPSARQCSYASRYYDTDVDAELLYHAVDGWRPPAGNAKRVQSFTANGTIAKNTSIVIVSASSGNVTLTLPKTPGSGLSREITVARVDNSGNTVSFSPASGDTGPGVTVAGLGSRRLITDGFTTWLSV